MTKSSLENQATIDKAYALSPIWFLPLIAAILGIWVLSQHLLHANVQVTIHFDNAEGIITDKTKVRYKGVIVGEVKKIELDRESGVNVITEIESHATFMLRENTKFWLVSPKASLTAISGLDTLFSGSYINLQPSDGDQTDSFTALDEPPIIIPNNALLVSLKSSSADSINIGTPIFYKKIKVGEVAQVRLDKSADFVNIKAFINHKYQHLIKEDSLFWNISGLNANISRNGIDFKLESLTSLIAGGITFNSPAESSVVTTDSEFQLFSSIDKANAGLKIQLQLNNVTNLPNGAGILFKGHGIGRITEIEYDIDKQVFFANAVINPEYSDLITDGAEFWIESTSLSFAKVKNLANIVSGDYVAFLPSENLTKNKQTQFIVQQTPREAKGLSLLLSSEDAMGLSHGSTVYYQGVKIGEVTDISFADKQTQLAISMNILPQYTHLINQNSLFYKKNSVDFSASMKGLDLQVAPFEQLVFGGIALYNKKSKDNPSKTTKIENNQQYKLYPSKELAMLGNKSIQKPLQISLLSKNLPSVSQGSPVYYHKLPIGEVTDFAIDDSALMRTTISIKGQYSHLIDKNSIFWNVSGFDIKAGLSGVNIKAESLLSIATGGIAVDLAPEHIINKYDNGLFKLFDNYEQATKVSNTIKILFTETYGLQVGSQLKFKGLVIGEVTDLSLTEDAQIAVTAQIDQSFSKRIARQGSRFGIVRSELSLTGTKNLSTLVTGVYINVNVGQGPQETSFVGEAKQDVDQIGRTYILLAVNAGSTEVNSPVYHRQIQIGEVTQKRLNNDASGVEVIINIRPQFTHLVRNNSIFWPAGGFNLNFGITGATLKSTSLNSLIKGGISMSTPDNVPLQPNSPANTRFKVEEKMQEEWLEWKMAIPSH